MRRDYKGAQTELQGLLEGESNPIANMANTAALLFHHFKWHWVGFYLVEGSDELILGPFQGPVACTRIPFGKGVCGSAWKAKETLVVPDVHQFPGHIACSPHSLSEIVVPVFRPDGKVWAVLDIDSDKLNDFSETDQLELEAIAQMLSDSIQF